MMLAGALTGAPGSDPSIDGCARQPSSPTACRCSADAHSHAHGRIRPNSHVANASDDGAQVWGLPSAGCSAHWTRYFTEVYPRKHAEWRAQGRVVVHCCPSSGLGNYLRSLPPALIYSMVTEQALTLHRLSSCYKELRQFAKAAQLLEFSEEEKKDVDVKSLFNT